METIGIIYGLCRDYREYAGEYRDNGKENGNYYNVGVIY